MANAMQKWRNTKDAFHKAREFIGLVGKPQRTTAKDKGFLFSVKVATQIHHQESDGAKNYHDCHEFDRALSQVVKEHFGSLSSEALVLLERERDAAAVAAKQEVDAMQDEISSADTRLKQPA